MNIIETKAVGKIILNETTPDREVRREHYWIPYYQRGYRWSENHVEALLEDIHNFIQSNEPKYCLQPIVLVPNVDENNHRIWEVLDGQQRLITMKLIFQYLNKPSYEIIFDKRTKSTSFLRELNKDNYSDENPDFHYLSDAYRIIKKWFDEKTKNDIGYIDEFNTTLTKKVEVIWYQIEELEQLDLKERDGIIESKKIDIFNRLNIGKIPLSDAELVRALLLSKLKHEVSEREAILRQAEMSNEWHRIEMELRNPAFWYFLNNTNLNESSSTIEFIFKLIAKSSDKKYSTYLWIEKKIKSEETGIEKHNTLKFWTKTKDYFSKLKYWFEDDQLFHQIGFLLANSKEPITTLKKIIKDSNCTKTEFRSYIAAKVKEAVSHIELDKLSYENNKEDLKTILLLHNIQSAYLDKRNVGNRFPFNLYKKIEKKGGWSIEHIHAQESIEIKAQKAIKKWLDDTYDSIKDISEIEKTIVKTNSEGERIEETKVLSCETIISDVKELKGKEVINIEVFNVLKNKVIDLFDSESVHILDNLALLSVNDNSALNNAIFPVKRKRILNLLQEGKYVPQTTRNVFLKAYSITDLQPYYWSKADKRNYFNDIKVKLSEFLTQKAINNE
ncbi:DUF262 domain-containing protein [Zobellia laminariae]|uniref:DUF262 domain-containing protein n=1 Tax=Zobellia laminariae TaxID=248906 RepID=UPI003EF14104